MIRTRHLLAIVGIVIACGESDRTTVRGDGVTIAGAFATASAAPDVSSLYFTIRNDGTTPDTLLRIVVPAGSATLHSVETEDGRSSMRPIDRLPILPGAQVILAPGGYHVMLTQLPAPLRAGDSVRLSAVFSRGDTLTVLAPVLTYTDAVERLDDARGQAP